MMIGTILEVMSEEDNAREAKAAHDERERMATQLAEVRNQLSELNEYIRSDRHR